MREGAGKPLSVSNTSLRINSILNSVTRRGTFIGNSAGVMGKFVSLSCCGSIEPVFKIALLYNGINSSIDAFRGKHDTMGSMAAGALTGALFKSTGMFLCFSEDIPAVFSSLCCPVSWHQTSHRCCYRGIRHGGSLELCEKECLIIFPYVFTTLISP